MLREREGRGGGGAYESVFLDEIDGHVPLASVADGAGQEVLDQSSVEGLVVGRLDDGLEEVVCLFDLVPVEQPRLAELELLEVVLAHHGDAEDVEDGEQPAAAGFVLLCHGGPLEWDLDVEDLRVCNLGGARGEDCHGIVV